MLAGIDDMCHWFRHMPLKDFPLFGKAAGYFYDWLAHPDDDEYWAAWNIEAQHHAVTVPACNVGGWYDIFLGGTIRNYLGMRERGGSPDARQGQEAYPGAVAPYLAAEQCGWRGQLRLIERLTGG